MHKYSPEIFIVLLYTMIKFLYLGSIQKPQNMFLQLSASLSRDDLYQSYPLLNRILDSPIKLILYLAAFVEYIMQI